MNNISANRGDNTPRPMIISPRWLQGALLTFIVGFTIMGFLATNIYRDEPPIPGRVVDPSGQILFTSDDIFAGQGVFQKYGLMEHGSILGHGAYLGPDYTAEYLHLQALQMTQLYGGGITNPDGMVIPNERVISELHNNRFDPATNTLTFGEGQTQSYKSLSAHYAAIFNQQTRTDILPVQFIQNPEELRQITAFFAWTAWTATANRPGFDYSYTNNWPPDNLVGNLPTSDAIVWSALSIIALLGGTGIVLFFFGRYNWLGWTGAEGEQRQIRFRAPSEVRLTAGQKATAWFFFIVAVLFFVQSALGGLLAHYRAEPIGDFFGMDLSSILPYNLTRTWHLQLSLFWVVAAFLAAGLFITPLISGDEPRGQKSLAYLLLGAVVLVVVGSLIGEAASIRNWLGDMWFWVGHQGWEYLDLGRIWQILLTIGLFFWAFIIFRGLRRGLRGESKGNLPYLFLYASLAIPVFYAAGLLANPRDGFATVDFWRFWVVHLWVEDFLELFTTTTVAYAFVLLGVITAKLATRVIYLSIILYSVGGVIGTLHHLYFNGSPVHFMALGAFFSAMEVIPLLLLTFEAWSFLRMGQITTGSQESFPHRWAVMYLVAVGVWNFVGAGIFGFLINLPIVSYYEIGTTLTANHAHGAMFGVYGMLAIGLLLFAIRYIIRPDQWNDRAAKLSFWANNLGLAWMTVVNLFPIGMIQVADSVKNGYWHARALDFATSPLIHVLEWGRIPGDIVIIIGGTLPLIYLCYLALAKPNEATESPEPMETSLFTLTTAADR